MIRTRILKHNYWFGLIAALFLVLSSTVVDVHATERSKKADSNFTQTDVDRAKHSTDASGIPILNIEGVGEVYHPAWTGLYALNYAGIETYDARLQLSKSHEKFEATISWLEDNLEQNKYGLWVWLYKFDSTYNDVSILAPWSSAFAQAVGIQALLAAYRIDGNKRALDLAKKAAISLITPIEKGGLLFRSGADIWFEEIPVPAKNPSHILNGHMRALLALKELSDLTGDKTIARFLKAGTDTLFRWLPLYDTGYWLRYDLNARKSDLLFRVVNPYGYKNIPLAIDRIRLFDPVNQKEVHIDLGEEGDANGDVRIAGIGWSLPEQIDGRSVRRLVPSVLQAAPDEMGEPYTYFYLELPSNWDNNLRTDRYELIIDYLDETPGNVTIQQRSIAPGVTFEGMRDGDLHLTGAGLWRSWRIPLRVNDLGYWVGISYAEKHQLYLKKIADWDHRFLPWAKVAVGYANLRKKHDKGNLKIVKADKKASLPVNTPVVPILSLDKDGVIMQHVANDETRWHEDGTFDNSGGKGTPAYSPYLIAEQLLKGEKFGGAEKFGLSVSSIKREPALSWLLNSVNYRKVSNASIYTYSFDNVYNDVETKRPWASAFGQAYVLKSLRYAQKEGLRNDLDAAILSAAKAYGVPVDAGGITTLDKSNLPFYEEVPNGTHVLNAHAVSIPELAATAHYLKNSQIQEFANAGAKTLLAHLYLYDTGYWLRYDQNPKKNLLLQLDWLSGDSSPLIHEVVLENPQTSQAVMIAVGQDGDFDTASRLSGSDWLGAQRVDGKSVRGFANGYLTHLTPVKGGTRQNTYLALTLPNHEFSNFFDVPAHRLVIRYKDVAKGEFNLKIQSINEGNTLKFVPLRGGLWKTLGDQKWKEISILVRPQDMGWYKGPDYQEYEIKQLERIENETHDWMFRQYAQRHKYFLEAQRLGKPVIIERQDELEINNSQLSILDSSPTYPGHGYENSMDEDTYKDYTAGKEGDNQYVILRLGEPSNIQAISFIWESNNNYPRTVIVRSIDSDGNLSDNLVDNNADSRQGYFSLRNAGKIKSIRIDFKDFNGQPRILMRKISIHTAQN